MESAADWYLSKCRKVITFLSTSGPDGVREHRFGEKLGTVLAVFLVFLGGGVCSAEELVKGVHLNAYLTQAYGVTDGVPLLGLDEDGTSKYRNAALLFRFDVSDKDQFIVQLSHEALGNSPLDALNEEVELDWAFYQRQFDSGTRVRVGRLPIPFGIYNQLRDVGTVLEFFRPPVGIYFEGAFASETVDGLEISHTFELGGAWSLEADAYLGSWDRAEVLDAEVFDGKAEDAFGAQLWLNTPLSSLRFGLAAQRFDQTGGVPTLRSGESDRFDTLLFSIDADFGRFVFHGEAQRIETSFLFFPDTEIPAYYVMAGYRFNEKLEFYALYEDSYSKLGGGPFPPFRVDPFYQDLAASLVYHFTPQVLLRLEYHQAETSVLDEPLPPSGEAPEVGYGILSFSASF